MTGLGSPLPRSCFAGFRFPLEVIMMTARWYLAAFDQQLLRVSIRQPAVHYWTTQQCAPGASMADTGRAGR